jgi:hypothetical protein
METNNLKSMAMGDVLTTQISPSASPLSNTAKSLA